MGPSKSQSRLLGSEARHTDHETSPRMRLPGPILERRYSLGSGRKLQHSHPGAPILQKRLVNSIGVAPVLRGFTVGSLLVGCAAAAGLRGVHKTPPQKTENRGGENQSDDEDHRQYDSFLVDRLSSGYGQMDDRSIPNEPMGTVVTWE